MGDRRRRLLSGGVVLVAAGLLLAAVVTDVQAQARARGEQSAVSRARHELSAARSALAATTYARALGADHRDALRSDITSTEGQLATAEQELALTHADAFLLGIGVGTLQSCLGGVQASLRAIAAHDNAGAARDLSAVSAACTTLANGARAGLVYPFDFPDPAVLRVGATYYAYATNSAAGNIGIIESTDLSNWDVVGNALPNLPAWAAPGATWAPGVLQVGGNFDLYYSAKVAGPGGGEECISVATAAQPQGPFTDGSAAPLECQASLGGSIDPSPFVDADGSPYLQWRSLGGAGQPATIWSERLDAAGTGFAVGPTDSPTPLIVADQAWEAGVVEAPDLFAAAGRYLLFFSGNDWSSPSYGVGVAICSGPLGPCAEPSTQPILSADSNVLGPGGESVFTDASGAAWIAFDGYAPGAVGYPNSRDLYLRRLDLSGTVPVVGPAS